MGHLRFRQALPILTLLLTIPPCNRTSAQNDIDTRLFRAINNGRSTILGSIINITDQTVEPVGVSLPVVFLGIGAAARDEETFDTGFLLAGSEIATSMITQSLKHLVSRERPYRRLRNVYVGHLTTSDEYSFPSGHTGNAFAIAALLTLRYPRLDVAVPAIAWAALIGYGRIYLGLHYPGDVMAGIVIGTGCSTIAYIFRERLLNIRREVLGDNFFVAFQPYQDGGEVRFSYVF